MKKKIGIFAIVVASLFVATEIEASQTTLHVTDVKEISKNVTKHDYIPYQEEVCYVYRRNSRGVLEKIVDNGFGSTGGMVGTGVGVAIDPSTMTLAQAQRLGAGLQAAFNQLEPYEVDASGKSIFDYILEPELVSKLRNQTDPEIQGVTRVATYDYCGRVTGYTDVPDAATSAVSAGSPVEPSAQPAATAIATTGTVVNTPSNATTNLTNPNPIAQEDIPSSPIGKAGDKKGAIATDGEHMYIATADYDGVTNIWKRASLGTW